MDQNSKKVVTDSPLLPFDVIVIVQDVLKRWLLIVLAALIVGVGAYIKTDMDYKPMYSTTTTFVVTARGTSTTVYSNLSSTSTLAAVFTDLLNSSILRKTMLSSAGISYFDGTIEASVVAETNLINVKVQSSDPRSAFLMAQAIIDHHEELTYQIVDSVSLEVLQKPKVPYSPINYADSMGQMKKMMLITAAVMVVLFASLSYFKDAVRSSTEAKSKLDCNFLGEIPHENKYKTFVSRIRRKKTSILITNPVTSFRYVETIRKLRHRVEKHMHENKVLMVTSLLENEGKSTVAVNLAFSLAQKHSKVLIIDCDLRKPACHAILEQKEISHGLRDVLLSKCNLSEALFKDKKTGLYYILESRSGKDSGDLLSSEKMRALLKWAKKEFNYIVIDSPPMAAVSDAESMAEISDNVLLVVRQNAAMAPALNKAVNSLESTKAKLIGCVLNNVYTMPFFGGQLGVSGGYNRYGRYGRYGKYGKYDKYGYYGNYAKNRKEK